MAKQKIKFTKTTLTAVSLPEKEKRLEIYDTVENQLLVRVSSTGRKVFQIYRWFEGRPVRVKIGEFPEWSVENARKKARSIKADLDNGINPNDIDRSRREEMTFADLFGIYLERHAKLKKRSWREDQRRYEKHLVNLANKRLSTIGRKHIAAIHSRIGRKHKISANRTLSLISSVYGRAIEFGLWEGLNPCRGIKKFPERSRDRFLLAGEMPRFFDALLAEPNTTIRDFFLVSLLTGARKSNVLSMRWKDVDLNEDTWKIQITKNSTPQTIPLGKDVLSVLTERRKNTSSFFVFPGNGKTGHLVEPKAGWKRILKRAGLENLRIHDLRRTLGSWQAMTGASLPIIGKSLNHKHPATTAIYARLDLNPVRESMQKATTAMLEAGLQEMS